VSEGGIDEGSLAEVDVADLVCRAHAQRLSGTLTLTHVGVARSIHFVTGRMVFASSTSLDDRLGELLLQAEKISLEQFTEVSRAMLPGKRLGTLLVERGMLSARDLMQAVVAQTKEIILRAFEWSDGHYRLRPGDARSEAITLKISTPDLILQGIHRIESWRRIERGMGGTAACYLRAEDYERRLAEMSLSFERLALLTDLHGTKSVLEICEGSSLNDFDVCRVLWAFRVMGAVTRVEAQPRAQALRAN
jgi:hypothetical protein